MPRSPYSQDSPLEQLADVNQLVMGAFTPSLNAQAKGNEQFNQLAAHAYASQADREARAQLLGIELQSRENLQKEDLTARANLERELQGARLANARTLQGEAFTQQKEMEQTKERFQYIHQAMALGAPVEEQAPGQGDSAWANAQIKKLTPWVQAKYDEYAGQLKSLDKRRKEAQVKSAGEVGKIYGDVAKNSLFGQLKAPGKDASPQDAFIAGLISDHDVTSFDQLLKAIDTEVASGKPKSKSLFGTVTRPGPEFWKNTREELANRLSSQISQEMFSLSKPGQGPPTESMLVPSMSKVDNLTLQYQSVLTQMNDLERRLPLIPIKNRYDPTGDPGYSDAQEAHAAKVQDAQRKAVGFPPSSKSKAADLQMSDNAAYNGLVATSPTEIAGGPVVNRPVGSGLWQELVNPAYDVNAYPTRKGNWHENLGRLGMAGAAELTSIPIALAGAMIGGEGTIRGDPNPNFLTRFASDLQEHAQRQAAYAPDWAAYPFMLGAEMLAPGGAINAARTAGFAGRVAGRLARGPRVPPILRPEIAPPFPGLSMPPAAGPLNLVPPPGASYPFGGSGAIAKRYLGTVPGSELSIPPVSASAFGRVPGRMPALSDVLTNIRPITSVSTTPPGFGYGAWPVAPTPTFAPISAADAIALQLRYSPGAMGGGTY